MLHPLTPDLCDPLLLAESTLPSFAEVVGLRRGTLKITYDPTIARPIRVRPSEGAVFDACRAKSQVGEMMEILNDTAQPFSLSFLKAKIHPAIEDAYQLDLMRFASSLQLYFLRAQACTDLIGDTIRVVVCFSMPTNDEVEPHVATICDLAGDGPLDPTKEGALKEYRAAVAPFWRRIGRTVVACWAQDNGISELRLTANILFDPREAMSAIGEPLKGVATQALQ